MKRPPLSISIGLMIFITLLSAMSVYAQNRATEKIYPKVLRTTTDSFAVRFSNFNEKYTLPIVNNDTVDMGTDGSKGLYAIIYTGTDSVSIPYTNLPYHEVFWISVQSPHARTTYRLHFNNIMAWFSPEYVKAHTDKALFEIPEAYELANIIWALSPAGKALGLDTNDEYYKRMTAWFKPYMKHPLIGKLDFGDSEYYDKYYDFRENSFTYSFGKDIKDVKLENAGPYYYVMGSDWESYNSLFKQMLPEVEDFAKKSNFRQFYKNNANFYAQQIKRQHELMPVKTMWSWLEKEFPKSKYQSYKTVFSPLITGSHSTQNFYAFYDDILWREAVMFVCGPDRFEKTNHTEQQKAGLASGIVFTEIDHNYVNPVSRMYRKAIDSIFSERTTWANKKVNGYGSAESVFNEYMTHAVFCLYIYDTYDKETADMVVGERISLMVDLRGFIKFKEFNTALMEIRKANPGKKVAALYPQVIEWCSKMNK